MRSENWGAVRIAMTNPREAQNLIDIAVDRLSARGFNLFRSEVGASYVRVEGIIK